MNSFSDIFATVFWFHHISLRRSVRIYRSHNMRKTHTQHPAQKQWKSMWSHSLQDGDVMQFSNNPRPKRIRLIQHLVTVRREFCFTWRLECVLQVPGGITQAGTRKSDSSFNASRPLRTLKADSHLQARVLVGIPEIERPLGKPKGRWEDNIKTDLQKVVFHKLDDKDNSGSCYRASLT